MRVYTDGGCTDNGKPYAKASYACYFPDNPEYSVSGRVPSNQPQTNNRGEMLAINEAVKRAPKTGRIDIFTDSDYCRKCLTVWTAGWISKNWKTSAGTPVINRDLIEETVDILSKFESFSITHIQAHTEGKDEHSVNNAVADKMATDILNPPETVKRITANTDNPFDESFPLTLLGPYSTEKKLVEWVLNNLEKIDETALHTALINALGKTLSKNGYTLEKQKLHRSTKYHLITGNRVIVE